MLLMLWGLGGEADANLSADRGELGSITRHFNRRITTSRRQSRKLVMMTMSII